MLTLSASPKGGGRSDPRVSVIIPAYNAAATLATAVESALNQDHKNLEIVVINDGSRDTTAAVASSFGERIVYIEQPNRGLSRSRNAGILASSGDVITLLDADDLLGPTAVSSRLRCLQADNLVGLATGYFREIGPGGELLPRIPELRRVELPCFRQAVRRSWGPPVGWTFWRSVFDAVGGFDPLLDCCEDWDFIIRVAAKYTIGYDTAPSVLYRLSPGQMTRNFERRLNGQARVHRKARAYASSTWSYRLDSAIGAFQHRRHALYDILFSKPRLSTATRLNIILRHPGLILVGIGALATLAVGKRVATSDAVEVAWYSGPS